MSRPVGCASALTVVQQLNLAPRRRGMRTLFPLLNPLPDAPFDSHWRLEATVFSRLNSGGPHPNLPGETASSPPLLVEYYQ